jgi:hypothetical protein
MPVKAEATQGKPTERGSLMASIYRPGERVPASGIYNAVDKYGTYVGYQRTCVVGEPFPPVEYPAFGFMLHLATAH